MILRRFFNLSVLTNQTFPTLHSRSFFSKQTQPVVEQPTNTQQNTAEVAQPQQEEVLATQKVREFRPKRERHHKQAAYVDPYFVSQFMAIRTNQNKMEEELIDELKNVTDKQQIFAKFEEFEAEVQKQKYKPLKKYEQAINLWPQNLLKNNSILIEPSQDWRKLQRFMSKILSMELQQQLKRTYETRSEEIQQINDTNFLYQVINNVVSNKSSSFLLNFLFENFVNKPRVDRYQFNESSLNQCLQSVMTKKYREANPLKFYWVYMRVNKQSIGSFTKQILLQLNKLTFNGIELNKELRSLTVHNFEKKALYKFVGDIFSKSNSLTEFIRLWALTVVIFSRIRSLENVAFQQDKVNFNDVFALSSFRDYFFHDLPQFLSKSGSARQYQIYRNALAYHSKNTQSVFQLNVGPLETSANISLIQDNSAEISYNFPADPIPLKVSYSKQKISAKRISSPEIKLVENVMQGKYESALDYMIEKIAKPYELQKINAYKIKGQELYQDKTSQALYTLQQIFRDSRYNIVQENTRLTVKTALIREARSKSPSYERREFKSQNWQIETKKQSSSDQISEVQAKLTSPKKPIFTRKPVAGFSSAKQTDFEQNTSKKSDQQYEKYLQAIKQIQSSIAQQAASQKPIEIQKPKTIFDFSACMNINDVQKQFEKKFKQINKDSIGSLVKSKQDVPFVGQLRVLIKHYFLSNTQMTEENQPAQGLNAEFSSSFGEISKDYNQYLKNCSMMFEFPNEFYEYLLTDQQKKINRQHFKRIVAHILLFKNKISTPIIEKICDICSKQKIGLTLLQIINLINSRQCVLSSESLKKVASSIQNFRNMESDLISFVRKYCDRTGTQVQTHLFQPYITSLTFTERYEGLNAFLEILRQEFKVKQYKIDPKLSAEQNIKTERAYKQKQQERLNKQLFEMISIVSSALKPRTTIPSFIPELFEISMSKKKGSLTSEQFGVGLIVTSQSQDKFLELLTKLKNSPKENNVMVFNSLINCLLVFGRNLKDQVQKILSTTLYQKRHQLTEVQLKNLGFVFNELDVPSAFTKFLEYVLKTQPPNNQQIKNLYYKVFNRTTDDHSKNQLSGLLDFIFNPTREKDRVQYKKVKMEEERKADILKEIMTKKQDKKEEVVQEQPVQVKSVEKQKKKVTKEDKKKLKQQKKQKKQSQKQDKNKQSDLLAYQTPQTKRTKREQKFFQKLSTSFQYDQNKKVIYNQRVSKRDLRKQSLVMFVDSFLKKYQIKADEDQAKDKKGKGKGKDVKQTSKSASKSAPKEGKKK